MTFAAIPDEFVEALLAYRQGNLLKSFVAESNRIEGITRPPTAIEVRAHEALLGVMPRDLTSYHVCRFVEEITEGEAALRDRDGMNVTVGDHTPPIGGPEIREGLNHLVAKIVARADPWESHIEYETLHPFTDGNGRSGRALWLWQMFHQVEHIISPIGFLHRFYYQTLSGVRTASSR